MRPSKRLHLLISTPTKLKGDVYAALPVLRSVRGMKRDSHGGGIADNRDPLFARLKLFHLVNIGSVHRDAFGGTNVAIYSKGYIKVALLMLGLAAGAPVQPPRA